MGVDYNSALAHMKSGGSCRLNGMIYGWRADWASKIEGVCWFDGIKWHSSLLHFAYRHYAAWAPGA